MPNNAQPSHDGPPSMVRALPTLGHAVVDWWAHGLAIIKDLAKHPERDPALAALIQQAVAVCGGPPSPLLDTTGHTLQLELSWGADGAWWITGISPMNKGPFLLQCWLLQLPALQAQWEKRMRSARLGVLKPIVPGAWLPQPETELPPGTVVAGLGVASWAAAATVPQVVRDPSGMMLEIKPATSHHAARYHRTEAGRVEKL
jgi:hypothetical protein